MDGKSGTSLNQNSCPDGIACYYPGIKPVAAGHCAEFLAFFALSFRCAIAFFVEK